jgi:outer membrane protein assembly factor BamA
VVKSYSHIRLLFIAAIPLLFTACNPTRKLKDGEYLLQKNHVINKETKIDNNDFESYIKQKPNRKIFKVFRFHLWLNNLVNEDRVKRKRILHDKKVERRNNRRIAKGKKAKKSNRQLVGEWLQEIGEPPVIYDSMLTKKSSRQLKLFLENKGYFISGVQDSVYKRRKRADVYYTIKASAPYTFDSLSYKIPDELLAYYVLADSSNTLIKSGENYDIDILQKERERITTELNNNGYYLFTKDYIYYSGDTNSGNRRVKIKLGIKNYAKKYNDYSDSIVETPHQRFYINNIYIQPDYISKKFESAPKDTLLVNDYYILHTQKLRLKNRVLLNAIFIRKGELYQLQNVEDSYKRLSELKEFKTINISFVPSHGEYLDCYIQLSPIQKQFYTIETEGTNTSGNLGIAGSFVYQNRNLFRGAEILELRIKGGFEAQKTFNDNTTQSSNIGDLSNPVNQFNTVEIGPEANLYIPRFLVPFRIRTSKRSNPKTIFTSSYTYQHRPDYTRYITNLSFAYSWRESLKKTHSVSPLVINFVKVDLKPYFQDYLETSVKDKYILNSFSDHLSTSTRYTFTFNEQNIKKTQNFSYFRINAESSGSILRSIYELANQIQPGTFAKDSLGRYKMIDVPFSHYLRFDADYRYYYNSNEINKVVFRIAAGIGIPLVNFPSLPFERSFYSGGANGIRAWQSRTLGPGSYNSHGQFTFDQFGDGQLEANIEYRFKLFKMLNGAVFLDGGNTWLRQVDSSRIGGDFQLNRFYKEIAIGSGVGLRADFGFFIIRFDIGLKIRDPQFDEDKRWVIQNLFNPEWKRLYRVNNNNSKYNFVAFNIGIGYPF